MFTGNILYQQPGLIHVQEMCRGMECCLSAAEAPHAVRLIFWALRWETGIEMLLHHIGWGGELQQLAEQCHSQCVPLVSGKNINRRTVTT